MFETNPDLLILLDDAVHRINTPDFIAEDPVQFPRRFGSQPDIEIVSLLSAVIAWGRRPMILRDCEKLLQLMDYQPLKYVESGDWQELPDDLNIHRTMFASHLKYMMRGFQRLYREYGTLESFCAMHTQSGDMDAPWKFAEAFRTLLCDENGGAACPECIPTRMDKTALKRINMALRWLVRNDGIVDMGVWKTLTPSQLYVPLDVHVGNISRSLGLLERKSNDRTAVVQLTEALRHYDSADPVKYDFALFGLGVTGEFKMK